jgi:hypothetical protein
MVCTAATLFITTLLRSLHIKLVAHFLEPVHSELDIHTLFLRPRKIYGLRIGTMLFRERVAVIAFLLSALFSFVPFHAVAYSSQFPMIFGHSSPDAPLKGWHWFGGFFGTEYEYEISDDVHYQGQKCISIRSLHLPDESSTTPDFLDDAFMPSFPPKATLSQMFRANQYRGKRMKFSALIKSDAPEGSAALSMMVNGPSYETLFWDDMSDGRNITGRTDWTMAHVVLEVPEESKDIGFAIAMHGKGQIWVTGLVFEETSDDPTGMKMYEDEPRNLDFSE